MLILSSYLGGGTRDHCVHTELIQNCGSNVLEREIHNEKGVCECIEFFIDRVFCDRFMVNSVAYCNYILNNKLLGDSHIKSDFKTALRIQLPLTEYGDLCQFATHADVLCKPFVIEVMNWKITVTFHSILNSFSSGGINGNGIDSLLNGQFCYEFENVPLDLCKSLYFVSKLLPSHFKLISKHCSKLLAPFHKLDNKIRLGMPFLIPFADFEHHIHDDSANCARITVAFHYEFVNV